MVIEKDYKKCSKCGTIKHTIEFNKGQNYCRICQREYRSNYQKQYYKNNKQKYYDYHKKYMSKFDGYYLYFICKDKEVLYVGATANIMDRVNCHHLTGNSKLELTDNDWTDVYYVSLPGLDSREELYLYESVFISELKEVGMCKLNQSNGYYHIDDAVKEVLLLEEAYHLLDHLDNYIELYCANDNK